MHSYEEIRDVVVDILLRREQVDYPPDQWEHLKLGAAQVLARRDNRQLQAFPVQRLSGDEAELVRDVFWDLFRQGYITLGVNDNNPEWPFFRLSHFGKTTLAQGDPYRFTDTSTYLNMVRGHVPDLDDLTSVYLDQAIRSFYAGCMLAACVMLGVATENRFLRLIEAAQASPSHATVFRRVDDERTILQKITKFWNLLRPIMPQLSSPVREDIETRFTTILSVIRTFRNDAGHPTGRAISREQTYVLLQMFAPYAQKLAQLGEHLRQT